MKIAFASPDLSPRTGSRRFIYEVTPHLQNLGHEVKIFTTKLDRQTCFKEFLSLPVEVVGASSRRVLSHAFTSHKENTIVTAGKQFSYYLTHTLHVMDIGKRIEEMGCQVCIAQYHGEHWLLPWFYHLNKTAGILYLNVVPTLSSKDFFPSQKIANRLIDLSPVGIWKKQSFRKLSLFLTPSKYQLNEANKLGIIGQHRSAVVPLGVNHSRFYPTGEEEPFVLYLGRIHPEKSLELAIQAMEYTDSNYSLVLAGDIEPSYPLYKEKLEKLAEKIKISNRFKIIPSPSDSEGVRLMQRCCAFLFPSTIDTFGLVVLEAMACGKPMVACNRGGVPEIVSDVGFLLEPNVKEWQQVLTKLLTDSKLRKIMGEKSFERSKVFSWENTAKALVESFKA
jgi:glycosyltransferase involved in cell wall biosynthesis